MSAVVGFLYILNEMLFSSFEMVMSSKLLLLSFSSSMVNFMVGIMLSNRLRTPYMFVVSFLYTVGISSTKWEYPTIRSSYKTSNIFVFSMCCSYISENMDEVGAPIANPPFCM